MLTADGNLELAGQVLAPAVALADESAQARLYLKGGSLVIEWSDGTQTLYTSIPLDSSGPYPATVTATTDTTAP